mgnify:CR=1 FL=1
MKKFFNHIYMMLKSFGYARAAAEKARMGDRQGAIKLMDEYAKSK